MPNSLTGDYAVVLQVSGRTVNRLLATMHQNFGNPKKLPTLPHLLQIRIGDAHFHEVVGGVTGTARVQIGVPSMTLLHGATDRFGVEAWVRAHYVPDPATSPLPEFIHGVVTAEFMVAVVVLPYTYGAARFTTLRLEVDPRTVKFTSATGNTSADAQITDQVRVILQSRLLASPHPLVQDFVHARFRSLVDAGQSAVVHPLGVGGAPPAGNIGSLDAILLGGRDFAVAVSREYLLALIEPSLVALRNSKPTFPVVVKAPKLLGGGTITSGTYTVTFDVAEAQWSAPSVPPAAPGSLGAIALAVSGRAETPADLLPNLSFSAQQTVLITFDAATETLTAAASGAPSVSADVNGPFGWLAEAEAEKTVAKHFTAELTAALGVLQPKLHAALGQKGQLVTQLQTLDDQGDAHFDAAEFTSDGFVLRGIVSLASRKAMSVTAQELADDTGYTAVQSWIPGGRIEEFRWTWYFQTTPVPPAGIPDGAQKHTDRFLLRATVPVPGIPFYGDGSGKTPMGRVCLTVKGRQLDAQTGVEQSVDNLSVPGGERMCVYVVPPPAPSPGGVYVKTWWIVWAVSTAASHLPYTVAHVEATGTSPATFNTLVHYAADAVAATASLPALAEALRAAGREDAGTVVVVVLPEGLLDRAGRDLLAALGGFTERVASPVMVTEDAQGGWSRAFDLQAGRTGSATRLVGPDGALRWRHDGPLDVTVTTGMLREHLTPADPPRPQAVRLAVAVGERAPDLTFELPSGTQDVLHHLRGRSINVTFVQPWSAPSIAQLRRLQRTHERLAAAGVATVAVVAGLDARGAETLAEEHGLSFVVGADPHEVLSRRFGVRVWPTTVRLDEGGIVRGVQMGADPGTVAALSRRETAVELSPDDVTPTP